MSTRRTTPGRFGVKILGFYLLTPAFAIDERQ